MKCIIAIAKTYSIESQLVCKQVSCILDNAAFLLSCLCCTESQQDTVQPKCLTFVQAIAAARAIAARLSGGATQSSEQAQPSSGPAHNNFPPPATYARPAAAKPNLPAGFGSSASAYPDLSASSEPRSDRLHSSGERENILVQELDCWNAKRLVKRLS